MFCPTFEDSQSKFFTKVVICFVQHLKILSPTFLLQVLCSLFTFCRVDRQAKDLLSMRVTQTQIVRSRSSLLRKRLVISL